jgi:signal transduction histidine kinase
MKAGLRLQIVLLLGGLMLVGFVPLFFAFATYTSYWSEQQRERSAQHQARAVADQLAAAAANGDDEAAARGVAVAIENEPLVAAVVLHSSETERRLVASSGPPELVALLQQHPSGSSASVSRRNDRTTTLAVRRAGVMAVVAIRPDTRLGGAAPLLRLTGLYIVVVALGVLLLAYFSMTRWIVRPLGELSGAAVRVAAGARRLEVPRGGARELAILGDSLKTMTERLLGEEEKLRRKVDEVERATRSLAEAQDSLVRSERLASVGRLAAGLAHEIGNPISALIGLQDLLIEGGLTREEERDFLLRMRKETERIHRILKDLLQFARPTPNSHDGPSEPGDVEAAIHDTLALVAPQKSLHDLKLELELSSGLPRVALSREQLMQVLLNLVLNAADACGAHGTIRILALCDERGRARISVEDTGPGVPVEVQHRLFEPFVTTKDVGKGTGLGLAVCRGLVEAAGGAITLDQTYTAGARFIVELPPAP